MLSAAIGCLLAVVIGPAPDPGPARGPRPLQVVVDVNSAPGAGERVTGIVHVTGVATAPEGITRVALYALEPGESTPDSYAVPVAEATRSLPVGPAKFDLVWDTRRAAVGQVDLLVYAETLLRDGGTTVPRFIVVRSGGPRAAGQSPAAPPPAAAPVSRLAPLQPARPASAVANRKQGVYAGGYSSALPYTVLVPAAPAERPLGVLVPTAGLAGRSNRSGATAAAIGFLLLICTAHAHRVLRVRPSMEGSS